MIVDNSILLETRISPFLSTFYTKYSRRILSLIERNIFTRKPSNEVSGSAANLSRIRRTRIFYKKKKRRPANLKFYESAAGGSHFSSGHVSRVAVSRPRKRREKLAV